MIVAMGIAVAAIRSGNVHRHRAWMTRAHALGQGGGMQVVILLPLALIDGESSGGARDLTMAAAWALNVVVAEAFIRTESRSNESRVQR